MTRVLLLFVDGVGLGSDDAAVNPFVAANLPTFDGLLGGARVTGAAAPVSGAAATLVGVDATMGVDGTPQSGTGQAALLTGENAVALHGRHFGPWVPARLRSLVREQNVLVRAAREGHSVAFANAYPEEVLEQIAADGVVTLPSDDPTRAGRRGRTPPFLRAGPPLAALGAGVLTRHTAELAAGHAVASEITNEGWRERLGRTSLPRIDAAHAGRNLAGIVAQHDLTLFAHYATDYAGHRTDMAEAVRALELVDAFLDGILGALPQDTLALVISDHGNIEDVRAGHTRNAALGLVIGSGHAAVAKRLTSLTDVAPAILDALTG
jgi:2,3-bisphosphoglycerate-independent phosphoglycerate mutase